MKKLTAILCLAMTTLFGGPAILIAVVTLGAMNSASFAHSNNEGTTPPDGAKLLAPPAVIKIVFDTPMRVTSVKLLNSKEKTFTFLKRSGIEPLREFSAKPPLLPVGGYTVKWRGLSADGHAMQGVFTFKIVK